MMRYLIIVGSRAKSGRVCGKYCGKLSPIGASQTPSAAAISARRVASRSAATSAEPSG